MEFGNTRQKLKELKELLDGGLISEEEHEKVKAQILSNFVNNNDRNSTQKSHPQFSESTSSNPLPPIPEAYDWEAFRQNGYKTVDFVADYMQALNNRQIPVQARVQPGYLAALLPADIPEKPSDWDQILNMIQKSILPGITHWQHPDFFAYFPCQLSPPALLGDIIANSYNQPGFSWNCSPAATEVEMIVTDWLVRALGLPESRFSWNGSGGCIVQPSATESAIIAILAAKTRKTRKLKGTHTPQDLAQKLVCYVSEQAHFCVEKAARIQSIPYFRKIPTRKHPVTNNFPIDSDILRATISKDIADGLVPFFLSGNYGATGTCAIDDLAVLAEIAEEHDMWYNVDAAYAGVTGLCPEFREKMIGIEKGDSILINGSKWMSTMFNTAYMFISDKQDVVSSLNTTGVYLQNQFTESGRVVDFKDYNLGLGRPFRSLKVLTTLCAFGLEGLQNVVRRHVVLASYLADLLSSKDLFEIVVTPEFGLVCFRIKEASNAKNKELLDRVNSLNEAHLVHTLAEGKVTLRLALCHPNLNHEDMDRISDLFHEHAKIVLESS